MTRTWTGWTASLAWGELLTSWHREVNPEAAWDGLPGETEVHVTVTVGLAVHAVAVVRSETPTVVTSPRDLRSALLAYVAMPLVRRSKAQTLFRIHRIGPAASADQLGLAEVTAAGALYETDILAWDTLTDLANQVTMWHLKEAGFRDEATLGDRLDAYENRPNAQTVATRGALLHAAEILATDF